MGEKEKPWSAPSIEKRSQFLEQMLQLSKRISTSEPVLDSVSVQSGEGETIHPDRIRLQSLMDAGDASEAFFLARRLVSQGEEWAEEWVAKIKDSF